MKNPIELMERMAIDSIFGSAETMSMDLRQAITIAFRAGAGFSIVLQEAAETNSLEKMAEEILKENPQWQ